MSHSSAALRAAVAAVLATAALLLLFAAQAPPAHADNCQAEELVTKRVFPPGHPLYESPAGDETRDPRCIVLKGLGCENASTPVPCAQGVVVRVSGTPERVRYCVDNYHPLLNASACDDVVFSRY